MFTIPFTPIRTHRVIGPSPSTHANHRARNGLTSIANQPHKHERAIARRLRQAERNASRQAERLHQFGPSFRLGALGVSRRGTFVFN